MSCYCGREGGSWCEEKERLLDSTRVARKLAIHRVHGVTPDLVALSRVVIGSMPPKSVMDATAVRGMARWVILGSFTLLVLRGLACTHGAEWGYTRGSRYAAKLLKCVTQPFAMFFGGAQSKLGITRGRRGADSVVVVLCTTEEFEQEAEFYKGLLLSHLRRDFYFHVVLFIWVPHGLTGQSVVEPAEEPAPRRPAGRGAVEFRMMTFREYQSAYRQQCPSQPWKGVLVPKIVARADKCGASAAESPIVRSSDLLCTIALPDARVYRTAPRAIERYIAAFAMGEVEKYPVSCIQSLFTTSATVPVVDSVLALPSTSAEVGMGSRYCLYYIQTHPERKLSTPTCNIPTRLRLWVATLLSSNRATAHVKATVPPATAHEEIDGGNSPARGGQERKSPLKVIPVTACEEWLQEPLTSSINAENSSVSHDSVSALVEENYRHYYKEGASDDMGELATLLPEDVKTCQVIHQLCFETVLRPRRGPEGGHSQLVLPPALEVWRAARLSRRAAAELYLLDVVSARRDPMVGHVLTANEVVKRALQHHNGSVDDLMESIYEAFPHLPMLDGHADSQLSASHPPGCAAEADAASAESGAQATSPRTLKTLENYLLANRLALTSAMLTPSGSNKLEATFGVSATAFPFLPCTRESVNFVTFLFEAIVVAFGPLTYENFSSFVSAVFAHDRPEVVRHIPRIFRMLNKSRTGNITFEELCGWIARKLSSRSGYASRDSQSLNTSVASGVTAATDPVAAMTQSLTGGGDLSGSHRKSPDSHLLSTVMSLRLPYMLFWCEKDQWATREQGLASISDDEEY